jgi:ferredoxin-NADP reductase
LTLTLRGLERDGLVTRTIFPTIPPRVDYELTAMGRTLLKPINALAEWSDERAPRTSLVKLLDRIEVAELTQAFRFEKPIAFTFKAGQYINLTLVDPPETDAEGTVRTFSIASAPEEDRLLVATRMRDSAFKRIAGRMPVGTGVRLEGPFGNLTLHADAVRPAVFLAGGIGITPFRSLLVHAARARLPHRLFLFYSNRRPEDAAFLDELQTLQRDNARYTFIGTMTAMEQSHRTWRGETGPLTPAMLGKVLADAARPIYYVAGPPGMVSGVHVMLHAAGVTNDDIRTEKFAGY